MDQLEIWRLKSLIAHNLGQAPIDPQIFGCEPTRVYEISVRCPVGSCNNRRGQGVTGPEFKRHKADTCAYPRVRKVFAEDLERICRIVHGAVLEDAESMPQAVADRKPRQNQLGADAAPPGNQLAHVTVSRVRDPRPSGALRVSRGFRIVKRADSVPA